MAWKIGLDTRAPEVAIATGGMAAAPAEIAAREPAAFAVAPAPRVTGHAPVAPEVLQGLGSGAAVVAGAKPHELRAIPAALKEAGAQIGALFGRLLGGAGAKEIPAPSAIEAQASALEDRAFAILEILTPKKIGQAEAAFGEWFSAVEARCAGGQRLPAMEHLAVLHILKEGLFTKHPALAAFVPRMEAVLLDSDQRLTGKRHDLDAIMSERLPRKVLRGESSDAQKIHGAIFASKDHSLKSAFGDLAQSYRPSAADAVVGAGILASLFTGTGAHLLAGAVHGYLFATLVEHVIHEKIGHATPASIERLDDILSRFGPIGAAIKESIKTSAFSHGTIHHGSYGGSYVDRFAPRDAELPAEERELQRDKKKTAIDNLARSRGESTAEQIFGSDYGRKLAHALKTALYAAPAAAIVSLFTSVIANQLGADLGPLFLASSVLASLVFVPASNNLHPYLHMTREEALGKAGPLMRAFLQSSYVSHIAQSHYLHHRYAGVNHNLVAGADFALGYEPTPVDAIVALRKMKTFY